MIIAHPNDGLGLLYHLVNLTGQTVHAYRDAQAALRRREGDQRIFIQDETTKRWLTGQPGPALSDNAPGPARLVPEATFTNFRTMRSACRAGRLSLASSTLRASDEPVALLCAIGHDGRQIVLTPFGHMAADAGTMIGDDGRLTKSAEEAFGRLHDALYSDRHQAWFGSDPHGRTTVTLLPLGVAPPPGSPVHAVMRWDNPYTLYTPPGFPDQTT